MKCMKYVSLVECDNIYIVWLFLLRMSRVIFISKSVRNNFFKEVFSYSNFQSWKELYENLNVVRSVFEKYKDGKLTLPIELYNKLVFYLNNKDKTYFSKNIKIIDSNWGQREGGKSTYSMHKNIFIAGRKKGLSTILNKNNKFDVNSVELNNDLAYFIGLFIGDGFSNKYGRHHQIQFVGNKKDEYNFYADIICPYVFRTFNIQPKVIEIKDTNYIRINMHSKDLFLMLKERFGISPGRKSCTVLIPSIIVNSSTSILLSCIAGIYDAESCVFWDKRKKYLKPYPRIDLHMHNIDIIEQINNILVKEGIKTSLDRRFERVLIYGNENISYFLSKVHLRNPKHLSKLVEISIRNN